jgi:hypothetical protein
MKCYTHYSTSKNRLATKYSRLKSWFFDWRKAMLTMNEWQKVIETAEKLKAKDLRLLLLKVYFKAVLDEELQFKYSDELLYWSKKPKKDILIYLEANQRLTQKAIRKEYDLRQSIVRLHELILEEMKSEKTS